MTRTIKGICFTVALIFIVGWGRPVEQIRETVQQIMTVISGTSGALSKQP